MRPNKDEYTGVVTIQYTERKTSLRDEGDGRRGGRVWPIRLWPASKKEEGEVNKMPVVLCVDMLPTAMRELIAGQKPVGSARSLP
jgi:hypothetical protein